MGEIIRMPIKDERSALWEKYISAARKAQLSHRIEDGLEAGKAWQGFLKSFEGGCEQK